MKSSSLAVGVLCLSVMLPFCLGCGKAKVSGRPELSKVSGKVLFKQAPLAGATVVFAPQNHAHAAVGITNANGDFQLQTYESGDGAAPGDYRVAVKLSFFDDNEIENNLIPSRYASPDESGLTAVVELGDENQLQFELME